MRIFSRAYQLSEEMIFRRFHPLMRRVAVSQFQLVESKESQTPFHRVMGGERTVVITAFGEGAVRGFRQPRTSWARS